MIFPSTRQTADDVALHYDSLDRFYREIWGEHVHHGLFQSGREGRREAVEALVALVAARLDLQPGEAVCDVGCGYGATARLLAERWGCAVTGVTVSEAQLAYARERYPGDNPRLLREDWLKNSFPSMSFDAVISIESSEHMVDKPRFFAEVARTLKRAGRFATCVWLAAEAPPAASVRFLLEPICREGRLPSMGSESEYRAMMAEAGLDILGFEDLTAHVWRTWAICLLGAGRGILTEKSYRDFLLDPKNPDRAFALTLLRILLAYRLGVMRYGLFIARRP